MQINIAAVGDRAIELRFQQIPQTVHDRLLATIKALTLRLLDRIHAAEPKLTGRLEGRTRAYFTDRENLIRGAIRAGSSRGDKLKAMALEYGAHGQAHVKAYSRASDAAVAAYTRRVNVAAHDFMRGPFGEMRAEILETIRRAFSGAITETESD